MTLETPIVSPPTCTLSGASSWAERRKAHWVFIEEMIPALYSAGQLVGVDPAVLISQSAKETAFGSFGGVIDASFHNPCGLKTFRGGANDDPEAHERFETWQEGAEAHANHLGHAYCGLLTNGHVAARTWQTSFISWAGTIIYVEELSGRWAPSSTYGHSVVADYLEDLWHHTGGPIYPGEVPKP